MESIEAKMKRLSFHHQLLIEMMDRSQYPFYVLVVERGLTEEEMMDVLALCETVEKEWQTQQEEGLLDPTPLLLHFVGMLNPKLDAKETIKALNRQGFCRALMAQLKVAIENVELQSS